MRLATIFLSLKITFFSIQGVAGPLNIVTTTTDLAWVAKKIASQEAKVQSLLSGTGNAHFMVAKPSYIRKVSNVDILCFNGLALEVGWLPKVLQKSGNAKVQSGGRGYCDASEGVEVLEKITGRVDRSMGDVHPEGNPHYSLSPDHLLQAGRKILSSLVRVRPNKADDFKKRFAELKKQLLNLKSQIQKKFSTVKEGLRLIQYHKEFSYFLKAYKIAPADAIEAVPGVPPSAGRLAQIGRQAKQGKIRLALSADYSPEKMLKQFQAISGIPYVVLPVSLRRSGKNSDYIEFQHFLADKIIENLKRK